MLDDKDVFSNVPSREELEDAIHKFEFMLNFQDHLAIQYVDNKAHLRSVLNTMKRVYKQHYGEVPE